MKDRNWLDRQLEGARVTVASWSERKKAALKAQISGEREMSAAGNVPCQNLREANLTRAIEWEGGAGVKLSLSYRGNELAGECGEACNILKKLDREAMGMVGSKATKDQLADELADVVICADLCAMDLGIDLDAAVARKFNKTSIKYGLNTRMKELGVKMP